MPVGPSFSRTAPHPQARSNLFTPLRVTAHAKNAVVFAQLNVDGQEHGVHAFVVPLRPRDSNATYPGILIGDCGHKMVRVVVVVVVNLLTPPRLTFFFLFSLSHATGPQRSGQRVDEVHQRARPARELAQPLCRRAARRPVRQLGQEPAYAPLPPLPSPSHSGPKLIVDVCSEALRASAGCAHVRPSVSGVGLVGDAVGRADHRRTLRRRTQAVRPARRTRTT